MQCSVGVAAIGITCASDSRQGIAPAVSCVYSLPGRAMTVVWVLILQFNSGPPGDGPPMTSVHEETEIVTKEYVSEEECEKAGMAWQESAAVSFVCELRTKRQLESQEKK